MHQTAGVAQGQQDNFAGLVRVIGDEVLMDFQEYIAAECKVPVMIWLVDESDGEPTLRPLALREEPQVGNEFCHGLRRCPKLGGVPRCCCGDNVDRLLIELEGFTAALRNAAHTELTDSCPMGITQLVIPIEVTGRVRGLITVGKFLLNAPARPTREAIQQALAASIEISAQAATPIPDVGECLAKLEGAAALIPVYAGAEIQILLERVNLVLPLIQGTYARFSENPEGIQSVAGSFAEGMKFLGELDTVLLGVPSTYEAMWLSIRTAFELTAAKLRVESAAAYFSASGDYWNLSPGAMFPNSLSGIPVLTMVDGEDLKWFELHGFGAELPIPESDSEGPSWLNGHVEEVFGSASAIVHGQVVFPGRYLLLGFGLRSGATLTNFERLLLRIAANRITGFVSRVATHLEMDYLLVLTGHKLLRTHGAISGGMQRLQRYGFDADTAATGHRDIIALAHEEISSGLNQLELIAENYDSFTSFAWVQDVKERLVVDVDVMDMLRDLAAIYKPAMQRAGKSMRLPITASKHTIRTDAVKVRVLFWNLIDNAVKFSYKNSTIAIDIALKGSAYHVTVENHGVGIDRDELEKVFEPLYRSKFTDSKKETGGQGLGLATVRRCVSLLFPAGRVAMDSRRDPYATQRTPGDHYVTTAIVEIPKGHGEGEMQ